MIVGGTANRLQANRVIEQSSITVAIIKADTFVKDTFGIEGQVSGFASFYNKPEGSDGELGFNAFSQTDSLSPYLHVNRTDWVLTGLEYQYILNYRAKKLYVYPDALLDIFVYIILI